MMTTKGEVKNGSRALFELYVVVGRNWTTAGAI